jgi:hypothetical protein
MTVLGYSCSFQSSLCTKNHRFDFLPKNDSCIHQKFIDKKGATYKSSEDINKGESLLMNVAPRYF